MFPAYNKTFNIINDYLNNDDQFIRKMTIPQEKFLDSLILVLASTRFTFNFQF